MKGMACVLSSLIALCPPPGPAVGVNWARAEGLLGLVLPDDYKALVEAYGVGWFSEWLMVNLPDSPYPQFELLHDVQDTVEWHRHSRDQQPATIPYAFHPEPAGLIRWGHTRTGDDFWWLPVADDPASWRIVASDHGVDWAEFAGTTTEFVHRLLTEQLILSVSDRAPQILPFADRRPHHPPVFRPLPVMPYPAWDADPDWDPRPRGLLRPPALVATREGWQAIIGTAAAGHAQPAAPAWAHPTGHPVPTDYLQLLAEHGPGSYAGLAVAAAGELAALGARVADRQRSLRGGQRFIPAHFHPEPGGLLAWGELPDGDACCWYPAGRDPATWPVVVCSPQGAGWQRYDLTTTAFLCEWLTGRVHPAYHTPAGAPLGVRLDRLAELLGASQAKSVVDWPAVEAELRLRLPADYRAFVERFGAGSINQELYIDTPFAPSAQVDLIAAHAQWAQALRELHQEFPEYEPYPPYPPPGGLLLWGKTNSRVSLSWRTDGPNPDAWPVVLFDDADWVDCGRRFLDILLDHLTGRDPLQGLIGFSPAWPPRWQPMGHREMLSPTEP
jgi:hypothetical protein